MAGKVVLADPGARLALVNPGIGEASTDAEIRKSNKGTAEALTRTPDSDREITSAVTSMQEQTRCQLEQLGASIWSLAS